MPVRLVALDEGPDIPLDRPMVVVGRHPHCDVRLDSIRISRQHCCMTNANGEVEVRDLGSTNGIRINGHRVERGRLRPGEELSIAHIRYRLEDGQGYEETMRESVGVHRPEEPVAPPFRPDPMSPAMGEALAAVVRDLLPADVADRCRIQVIVQREHAPSAEEPEACRPNSSP